MGKAVQGDLSKVARSAALILALSLALPVFGRESRSTGRGHSTQGLSASDLGIASLGSHLRRTDPSAAKELLREVEEELPAFSPLISSRRRAGLVRERFLDRSRRNADLDREEIVVIDGWVLARSEGAAAVYLSHLAQPFHP